MYLKESCKRIEEIKISGSFNIKKIFLVGNNNDFIFKNKLNKIPILPKKIEFP